MKNLLTKKIKVDTATYQAIQVTSFIVGMTIGAVRGVKIRKKMVQAGMVKSFWYGSIKEPGTYDNTK